MNKQVKKFGCLVLAMLTACSTFAGCKGDDSSSSSGDSTNTGVKKYDTENRAVVFATDALDGNFNPFFATSATDTTIAAMTQVGMLTTDSKGNPKCGNDVPTVVYNYNETMLDADGNETNDPMVAQDGGSTEYEFIIKNGMKFSDGVPLTIRDVLFNLYVYLDPQYMGSATIYSTDIKGLKAYRMQDPYAGDSAEESGDMFTTKAMQRVTNLLNYLDPEGARPAKTEEIEKDIAKVEELFLEEVTSDWNEVAGTLESYKEEYNFTEDWEIYYFNEGLVSVQYTQGKPEKVDGKYVTSLDKEDNMLAEYIEEARNDESRLAAIMSEKGCSKEEAKEYAVQEFAIETVYETYMLAESTMADVVRYWETGSNLLAEIAAEERSEYYENKKNDDGSLLVDSISGITTYKTSSDFDGKDLGAEHDVLKIVINGIDPKAIWNFAFSVSPMHYYSNADTIAKTPFGVDFGNIDFFNNVLQDPEKNGVPVGAGVYKASNENGSSNVNKNNFYRNNWVYFERNEYFHTMGDETVHNAKIKYLNYRVVGSDKLLQALESGEIDFGSPQATTKNIEKIGKTNHLYYKDYMTNGYGYVGINPKYVPDIEVRRAIMMALDTSSIVANYYTTALAQVAYRSMSALSWAYPEDVEEYYEYTTNKETIRDMVEDAGWSLGSDGIYAKDGKKLEITFTIAGESKDHPAYQMFIDARDFLNECGFDITISTDATALRKLATGGLAVWAAAWSSTVDPDLYQVYHKDSKATSIKNWGYETIMADNTTQFTYEKGIINDLSNKIEEARETLDKSERKEVYAEALDLIMELAVELPTYQRKDLVVYNKDVINPLTLNQNANAYEGVYDRLWEVDYN
ncbi:MAG: hypothetical protein E7371_03320 [Clostridiales bacterium]|nr:hypothetical protein [Clostridiales bacterium]